MQTDTFHRCTNSSAGLDNEWKQIKRRTTGGGEKTITWHHDVDGLSSFFLVEYVRLLGCKLDPRSTWDRWIAWSGWSRWSQIQLLNSHMETCGDSCGNLRPSHRMRRMHSDAARFLDCTVVHQTYEQLNWRTKYSGDTRHIEVQQREWKKSRETHSRAYTGWMSVWSRRRVTSVHDRTCVASTQSDLWEGLPRTLCCIVWESQGVIDAATSQRD